MQRSGWSILAVVVLFVLAAAQPDPRVDRLEMRMQQVEHLQQRLERAVTGGGLAPQTGPSLLARVSDLEARQRTVAPVGQPGESERFERDIGGLRDELSGLVRRIDSLERGLTADRGVQRELGQVRRDVQSLRTQMTGLERRVSKLERP